jgi:hypothetical protein
MKYIGGLILILILLALTAVVWVKSPAEQRVKANTSRPFSTKAQVRLPTKDSAFWNSAVVAEPTEFREPSAVAVLASAAKPQVVDYSAEVARLLKEGDGKGLNFALAAWFDVDASAARDWLAQQNSLDDYQLALIQIVGKIATAGDPTHALEWAALLSPGPEQEQAVFDAYVVAARGRLFTEAELRAAPLSEERVADLLGGAPGH